MSEAFFAVLPVFFVIYFGTFLNDRDILPEQAGTMLGLFAFKVALPCLILHILSEADPITFAQWEFWLGAVGCQVLGFGIVYWMDRTLMRRGTGPALVSALNACSPNVAFVGIPIVTALLPGNTEALLIVGLAAVTPNVMVIFSQMRFDMLAGHAAWSSEFNTGTLLKTFLLENSLLLFTVIGFILSISGLGLWEPLDRAVALVGYSSVPCMLLSLGLSLRERLRISVRKIRTRGMAYQLWLVLWKLLFLPALCWGIMELAGAPHLWTGVCVLSMATGSGMVASVLAQVYSTVPEEAALTTILSNGLSVITLSLIIYLFEVLGYFA